MTRRQTGITGALGAFTGVHARADGRGQVGALTALRREFAWRAHERHLAALLATPTGPYHTAWAAELARLRARRR